METPNHYWLAIKELDKLVLEYYKQKKKTKVLEDFTSCYHAAKLALWIKYKEELPREFLLENISTRLVEKQDEKLIRRYIRNTLMRDIK